jgi:hypothetical protein
MIPIKVSSILRKEQLKRPAILKTQIRKAGPLKSVFFPDGNTGYATGKNGTILKTSTGGD